MLVKSPSSVRLFATPWTAAYHALHPWDFPGKSTGVGCYFLLTPLLLVFPCGPAGKESACNAGDLGSIPGMERSPGEGKGYTLQYSGLENPMDCVVHGVTKSRAPLSDFFNVTGTQSIYGPISPFHFCSRADRKSISNSSRWP